MYDNHEPEPDHTFELVIVGLVMSLVILGILAFAVTVYIP